MSTHGKNGRNIGSSFSRKTRILPGKLLWCHKGCHHYFYFSRSSSSSAIFVIVEMTSSVIPMEKNLKSLTQKFIEKSIFWSKWYSSYYQKDSDIIGNLCYCGDDILGHSCGEKSKKFNTKIHRKINLLKQVIFFILSKRFGHHRQSLLLWRWHPWSFLWRKI